MNCNALALFKITPLLAAIFLAPSAALAGGTVLLLNSSTYGGINSPEAQAARDLGFAVDARDGWAGLSTADFASYKALILGDPIFGQDTGRIQSAIDTRGAWSPAVQGNIFIIASDPVNHGRYAVTLNAIKFATAGRLTGMYMTTSHYYANAPSSGTGMTVFDQFGSFTIVGESAFGNGCPNNSHIIATHPALAGLADGDLSNWSCSAHAAFIGYPSTFQPLVVNYDIGGLPYVLARGAVSPTVPPPPPGDGSPSNTIRLPSFGSPVPGVTTGPGGSGGSGSSSGSGGLPALVGNGGSGATVPISGLSPSPGATLHVIDNNTTIANILVASDNTFSGTVVFSWGGHSVTFTQTSIYGLTSAATPPINFAVVPPIPTVGFTGQTGLGSGSSIGGTFTFVGEAGAGGTLAVDTAAFPGLTLNLYDIVNGVTTLVGSLAADSSGNIHGNIGPLPYGDIQIFFTLSVGSYSSTRTAPQHVIVVPPPPVALVKPNPLTNNPTFSGTGVLPNHASNGTGYSVTVTALDSGVPIGQTNVSDAGTWSIRLSLSNCVNDLPGYASCNHQVTFTQTSGFVPETSAPTSATSFIYWITPPQITINSPPAGQELPDIDQAIRLTYRAVPAGVTVPSLSMFLDGATLYTGAPAGQPSQLDFTWLYPGSHTYGVQARDNVANADATPFTSTFIYAPSIDTDIALTGKLTAPYLCPGHRGNGDEDGDHEDQGESKDDDERGPKCVTAGRVRHLLHQLNEVKALLHPRPDRDHDADRDDGRERNLEARRELVAFERYLARLVKHGQLPAKVGDLLAADADWLLRKLGGAPRVDDDHERQND